MVDHKQSLLSTLSYINIFLSLQEKRDREQKKKQKSGSLWSNNLI